MRRSAARRQAGFTLVELMIAMAVATIAILGLVAAATAGSQLQRETAEYSQASREIQAIHERLRGGDLDAVFADLTANPTFQEGQVTLAVAFPESLLTDQLGAAVPVGWRYRDLDDDGQVELDPGATVESSLLPVTITARWSRGFTRARFLVTER